MKIIDLDSINNIRDFSYGNIKEKMLLRSQALDFISDDDFKVLYNDYHLRTIIDLRSEYEISKRIEERFDINYYNIPLVKEDPLITKPKNDDEIILHLAHSMPNNIDKSKKYWNLLKSKEAWQKIFSIILNNEEGSILICCHQGKDRTGLVCALLLNLLKIDYKTIIDDYLLTNDYCAKRTNLVYEQVTRVCQKNNLPLIPKESLMAQKEYIDGAFAHIKDNYNGFDNFYEKQCGLTKDQQKQLLNKYLK